MDIHKPKPAHNWREFLSEIGVIVVGVLIALSAEQAVEALHWHHQLELEREAMRGNVEDQVEMIVLRQVQQPCVQRRLAELALVFRTHQAGGTLNLLGAVGRPQNNSSGTDSWDVAMGGQAVAHMPRAERNAWAWMFGNFRNLENLRVEADRAWVDLAVLDHPEVLQDGDWVALRQAYARASATEGRIKLVDSFVLNEVVTAAEKQLKIDAVTPKVSLDQATNADYSKAMCRPLLGA